MLHLTNSALSDLNLMLNQEWLESNSRGSYASGNVLDCPTRRYHGLLVSDAGYLPDKHVLLAKLEASITIRGRTIDLYSNKHPGSVFYPEGYSNFDSFRYDLVTSSVYRAGTIHLERSQMLLYQRDAVLVRYRLQGSEPVQITVRPLLAYRSHHHLAHESSDIQVKTFPDADGHKIEPLPQKPPLYMGCDQDIAFYPGPFWVKQVEYSKEQERGFDYQEDLFCPGLYETVLEPGQELTFVFGLSPTPRRDIREAWNQELLRRTKLRESYASEQPILGRLKYEGEKFLIAHNDQQTSIVAGYPWFGEWGRDTMIALPGLTLGRGQPERLLPVVRTWLQKSRDGLIPNYLGASGQSPSYNSVDAVLWMFSSLQQYWVATHDREGLASIIPELLVLVRSLIESRHPLVRVDADGLMQAGNNATQLTWMDAAVDGRPVTPRSGYPVEVNALWLSALMFMQEMSTLTDQTGAAPWISLLEHGPAAFRKKFWLADGGYLADCISSQGEIDRRIRPNQILAVSLDFSPLNHAQQQSVVDVVTTHLLTPFGLRTLSPEDPSFVPFYQGGPKQRDAAYHQGTVWPWLLSPYAKAVMKVAPSPSQGKTFLRQNLEHLWHDHLSTAGLMGVSEIFDGYSPFTPDGCIFQAWSHSAIIEVLNLLRPDPEES